MNTKQSTTTTTTVAKYGSEYPCEVVKTTPTRHLVRLTQKSGKTVERWVPRSDVKGWTEPTAVSLAETIKAAAESDVAEVINLKVVAGRKGRKGAAHNPKGRGLSEAAAPATGAESEHVAKLVAAARKAPAKSAKPARKSAVASELHAVKSTSETAAVRLGDAVGDFQVRWPKAGADLLQRIQGEGAAWRVRCNAHGSTVDAKNVKEADVLGRKAQRVTWCAECAKA